MPGRPAFGVGAAVSVIPAGQAALAAAAFLNPIVVAGQHDVVIGRAVEAAAWCVLSLLSLLRLSLKLVSALHLGALTERHFTEAGWPAWPFFQRQLATSGDWPGDGQVYRDN